MSMIFQSYAIWPNMTVAQNVAFGLKLRKLPSAEVERRVGEMLEIVQLGHLAKRYPAELSGGQQQRVALARAIVVKPSVLLLDEPLSNLDANLREEMRFEIRRLHDEFHITTVYVTHDQAEAMATSDRIAVMHAGRIEQVAPPHMLYTKPRTKFVAGFIGRTNLLEASFDNGEIGFDGFAMKTGQIDMAPVDGRRSGLFSVRPQGIALHAQPPASAQGALLLATITGRVYLGESWDYTVAPDGSGTTLRVAAPPLQVLDVGAPVWLEFDPRQMALVE
jgi:iron(III) transport system ATP-binding protein